ncbi:MAG: hypothetical protein ACRCVE_06915 [Plesiomonas sp.]
MSVRRELKQHRFVVYLMLGVGGWIVVDHGLPSALAFGKVNSLVWAVSCPFTFPADEHVVFLCNGVAWLEQVLMLDWLEVRCHGLN